MRDKGRCKRDTRMTAVDQLDKYIEEHERKFGKISVNNQYSRCRSKLSVSLEQLKYAIEKNDFDKRQAYDNLKRSNKIMKDTIVKLQDEMKTYRDSIHECYRWRLKTMPVMLVNGASSLWAVMIRINTIDSLNFCYFPITKSRICLSVKASHDARIALRTHLGDDSNVYEIIIGGWGNTMSAIKRNNVEPDVAEENTRDILNAEEICDIWLQWSCDGLLSVGRESDDPFMSYKDRDPFVINYIGVGTAWGATGEWIMEESHVSSPAIRQQLIDTCNFWVDYNDTVGLPRCAVMASEDGLYIGRARHRESMTPGGIRGSTCTIPWGGAAHEKKEFQVLCGKDINWVKAWQGSVPLHALPAGETEDENALFIGRVFFDGAYHVGKIQPNHQVCYVPFNGQETSYLEYEVLVVNDYPILECIGR